MHIDIDKLLDYDRDHLTQWLKFRGDGLKHVDTMKSLRSRVLEYIKKKTDQKLLDPTLGQIYKKLKAEKFGIQLPVIDERPSLNPVPACLVDDIADPKLSAGWSKDLNSLPRLTLDHIEQYHQSVNEAYFDKPTKSKSFASFVVDPRTSFTRHFFFNRIY